MKSVLWMSLAVAAVLFAAVPAYAQVGAISAGGAIGAAGALPGMNSSSAPPKPSVSTGPNGIAVTIPGNPESSPAPETPNLGVSSSHSVGQQPPGASPGQTGSPGANLSVAGKIDTSDLTSLPPSGSVSATHTGSGGAASVDVNETQVNVSGGSQ